MSDGSRVTALPFSVFSQCDAQPAAHAAGAIIRKPLFQEGGTECFWSACEHAPQGRPPGIVGIQVSLAHLLVWPLDTALQEERCDNIHFRVVVIGRQPDGQRSLKSLLVPGQTALHGAAQNARQLGQQFLCEPLVPLRFRDGDRKRKQVDARHGFRLRHVYDQIS